MRFWSLFAYVSSEGLDEPAQTQTLAVAFAACTHKVGARLAPALKTIFHQCAISYTCSQSYSDGSVLKQSHQSKTSYEYML